MSVSAQRLLCLITLVTAFATSAHAQTGQPRKEGFINPFNLGSLGSEKVATTGYGHTQAEALLDALNSAITQVNGLRVGSAAAGFELKADMSGSALAGENMQASAVSRYIETQSQGAVLAYRITNAAKVEDPEVWATIKSNHFADSKGQWLKTRTDEVEAKAGTYVWKVSVDSEIAKYKNVETHKPKLVVLKPSANAQAYVVGDARYASKQVADEIQEALIGRIGQTRRFELLTRDNAQELSSEEDFINNSGSRQQDIARLGQKWAADLLLVARLEEFRYAKTTRRMPLSDKELVEYSGGAKISVRLLDAVTGRILASDTLSAPAETSGPSTLNVQINPARVSTSLIAALTAKIYDFVVSRTFPVSVLKLNGDELVLNQGASSLEAGKTYDAVVMGDEVSDPQTGNSLGRMETPCCQIAIDRVSDNLSYGRFVGSAKFDPAKFVPGMIELRGRHISEVSGIKAGVVVKPQEKQQIAPKLLNQKSGEDKNY